MKTNVLAPFGISEKGTRVYMAALSLGTTSVQEIARKTSLKRPTVYVQIDALTQQGLFESVTINKKRYYRAIDPRTLEPRLREGIATLQAAIPEFLALQAKTPGRPTAVVMEGNDGVERVYRELAKESAVRIWSNIEAGNVPFHDINMKIAEELRRNKATVREIIADTAAARRYARLVAKTVGQTYSVRAATIDGLANDSIIYGDVIALFRLSEHNRFVVRIEDKQIAESMKALFDMAWKSTRALR